MRHTYLFEDIETGEEFFVEEENFPKANEIAFEYFLTPKYIREVSAEFAEMCGLDTY